MMRYLRIYRLLIRLNYHMFLAHRADSLKGLFASIMWGVFSFVLIYALTSNSETVFGWSRQELLVLTGVGNIIVGGLFRTIFNRNFDNMTTIVRRAELDSYLIKPIDSQFLISFLFIQLYGVVRLITSILLTVLILHLASIPITFFSSLSFFVLVIFGLIVLYAVWFLIMTFIIWFPDLYNISEILYAADALARYPPEVIWALGIPLFFMFFPHTLVVSTPTKVLIHTVSLFDAGILIMFACGLLFLSRKFWKFALRYYTSASG